MTALALNCPLSSATAPRPVYYTRLFYKETYLIFAEFSRMLFHVFFGNFAAGFTVWPETMLIWEI
jgi:hypothetical protein